MNQGLRGNNMKGSSSLASCPRQRHASRVLRKVASCRPSPSPLTTKHPQGMSAAPPTHYTRRVCTSEESRGESRAYDTDNSELWPLGPHRLLGHRVPLVLYPGSAP